MVEKNLVNDTKLGKRVASLFAVGAFPATFTSLVGDFFGPKSGWVIVGVLGVVALLFAVYCFITLATMGEDAKPPIWYRLFVGDAELNWVWRAKSPFLAHGVHVLLLFGLICLIFSGKTYAALGNGGVLAKNIPMVSGLQEFFGVFDKIKQEQEKTNQVLTSIYDSQKRETSEDPQKELANLQYQFKDEDFVRAVQNRDVRAVRLYGQAGFYVASDRHLMSAVLGALSHGNKDVMEVVSSISRGVSYDECISRDVDKQLRLGPPRGSEERVLFHSLCGKHVVRIKEILSGILDRHEEKNRSLEYTYKKWGEMSEEERQDFLVDKKSMILSLVSPSSCIDASRLGIRSLPVQYKSIACENRFAIIDVWQGFRMPYDSELLEVKELKLKMQWL